MSKKRGLSLEEKRERLLGAFFDSQDFFVLKDVEKMGAKKGIPLQNVKEILQSLIDDDLVNQEKIGISNYFWVLTSEAGNKLINQKTRLEERLQNVKKRQIEVKQEKDDAKQGREDTAERTADLELLRKVEAENVALKSEVQKYSENDPETFEKIKKAVAIAKESANRWLDNTYSLHSWCSKKFESHGEQLDAMFKTHGFSDDLEPL